MGECGGSLPISNVFGCWHMFFVDGERRDGGLESGEVGWVCRDVREREGERCGLRLRVDELRFEMACARC